MDASSYEPPDWKAIPVAGVYKLEVLKDGIIAESIDLNSKDHWLIGRNEDICDIPLAHPSISRQHAVLQFKNDKTWHLMDLSTHGSFINKQAMDKGKHVQLQIGDFLKFGDSTRLFILCGPPDEMTEEYDSENLQRFRQQLNKSRERKKATSNIGGVRKSKADISNAKEEEEDNAVTWGMADDAPDDEDDHGDGVHSHDDEGLSGRNPLLHKPLSDLPEYLLKDAKKAREKPTVMKEEEVHKRDMAIYEKIRARQYKIDNMTAEIEKIRAKELSQQAGLTAGQEAQIQRNEAAIVKVLEQIRNLENTIREKNEQRSGTVAGSKSARDDEEAFGDDDDDFFDRTAVGQKKRVRKEIKLKVANHKSSHSDDALTAAGLQEKLDAIELEKAALSKTLGALEKESADAALAAATEEIDPLDAFMKATDDSRRQHNIQDTRKQFNDLDREAKRHANLLRIARPAMAPILVLKTTIDEVVRPALATSMTSEGAASILASSGKTLVKADAKLSEPEEISKIIEVKASSQSKSSSTTVVASVSEGHATTKATSLATESSTATVDVPKKRPYTAHLPPPISVAAIASEATEVLTSKTAEPGPPAAKRRKVEEPGKTSMMGPMGPVAELEGGDVVWEAPKDQAGDGVTALNKKYGY